MSALLERYEQQAVLLGETRSERRHLRSIIGLANRESQGWKAGLEQVRLSGDPTALAGGFAGLEVTPATITQTTVTGGATELAMIPTSLLPVARDPQVPKFYRLFASGTSTTAATPGTYTLASRIGPAPTNASPLFGAVSGAFTPVASATAAQWEIMGWVLIRTGGTAAVAVASFQWTHSATIGGGGPSTANSTGIIGGISATFDSTLTTTALWIGVTHATSTTNTWVPQSVAWGSWN